jgi:hypothetical protein
MAAVASTRRQGRSSPRSPKYFDTGEQQAQRERKVTMTQPSAYARHSQQDAHDKLDEPARWVLYATDFDKSQNPAMDKARAQQWMNMYSILDRSTFEESCVQADRPLTLLAHLCFL